MNREKVVLNYMLSNASAPSFSRLMAKGSACYQTYWPSASDHFPRSMNLPNKNQTGVSLYLRFVGPFVNSPSSNFTDILQTWFISQVSGILYAVVVILVQLQ